MNEIETLSTPARDYEVVKKTLAFIHENWREQPSLEAIAEQAELSPTHLQRLFKRTLAATPGQYRG